jgi:hypothetical protein
MKISCLEMCTRSAFHFKLATAIRLEHATFEGWIRFDRFAKAMFFVWESGAPGARRRGALRLIGKSLSLWTAGDGLPLAQELLHDDLGIWNRRWHHLAVTLNGPEVRVYKDGDLASQRTRKLLLPQPIEECGPLVWGMSPVKGETAHIHAARVWSRVLSEAEIQQAMYRTVAQGEPDVALDCRVRDQAIVNSVTGEHAIGHWPISRVFHPSALATEADADAYVINGVDLTLTQDMLPAGGDVIVFADTITLPSILTHAGNLTIFARQISAEGATVDLSCPPGTSYPQDSKAGRGADGTTPGAPGGKGLPGEPGGRGQDGGHFHAIGSSMTKHRFAVTSRGGDGGRGQGGGPGGDGAQGPMGADSTGHQGDCAGPNDNSRPGGQGGNAGDGGDAGRGGDGGNGGDATFTFVEFAPKPSPLYLTAGQPGLDGSVGDPGGAGAGGLGGRKTEAHGEDTFGADYCYLSDDRNATGPSGGGGSKGNLPSSSPVQGTNGQLHYAPSDVQGMFPITLATRTLRKAERCYFNSDYATANTLLVWLQQTCRGDGEWATIQKRAATLLSQLAQGLSFYGRPRNAVPLADAPTYLSTLNTLQTSGGIVEQDYFRFLDQQKAAADRIAALKNQLAGVQGAVAQLTDQMTKAADQQGPVNDAIEQLHVQIEAQYNTLVEAATSFQTALAAKVGCETFMAVLNGAAAVVTTSADGFADLQKMQTAISSLKGSLADLNVIVKQIQTAAKDINSVKSAWTGLAGAIKGGPDAGKIAVEKGDFDQMMQPYLAMPEAQAYVAAMHAYMTSVQARNEKLRQSDALVVLQAQIQATIDQKQAESNRVSNLVADQANQDPTLADYVAFMEGAYQDMQALLLRYLFEANAALDYYTLNQADIQVGSPNHALSMGDIASAIGKITTTLPSFINNSNGPRDPFAALSITLSAAPAGSYSPGADPFARFITGTERTHELPFSVRLDSLPGLYQVTATAFTIAVPGFATTNNQIMVRLRHSGYAPFLDANGKTVEFTHNQVEVYYAYSVDKQGNSTYVGGGALSDTNYIGLSPCTSWQLSIREAENPGLDLSKVTQVLVSFSGKSRLSQR